MIKRNLTAKSKGSSFTLNGASATGTEIKAKMAELNVQVGNLWYVYFVCFPPLMPELDYTDVCTCSSFLPQDKVSEFAQMSSQQLLKETQRAAGDENLSAWHQTLMDSGKELKGLQDVGVVSRPFINTFILK